MATRLTLHYDLISPFSYIALVTLTRYAKLWDIELELVPVNQGYILKTSGNRPPITVPNKGKWMHEDMHFAQSFYGLTLNQPQPFPFNSYTLQCVLRTFKDLHPPHLLHSATMHFHDTIWGTGSAQSVLTLDGITDELKRWGQLSAEQVQQVVDLAGSKEMRSKLNQESARLAAAEEEGGGAFGVPWIITEKDGRKACWFGSDRTEQIAAWLGKPYRGPMADGSVSASKL